MPFHTERSDRPKRGKQLIKEMLTAGDLEAVVRHSRQTSPRRTFRYLLTFVHHPDEQICWRAIKGCGLVAGVLAEEDLEGVRELIRRLLWWMNDESGALLRTAPEIIAEILINVDPLVDEYAKLLPHYLVEEPFERGTHWAIFRLAKTRPDVFKKFSASLIPSLDSKDPWIREYATKALALIDINKPV